MGIDHQGHRCGTVGEARPATAEAGRAARTWLRERGFHRWGAVLSDFLPADAGAASETA